MMIAGNNTPEPDTGDKNLDSLLISIYNNNKLSDDSIIDRLKVHVYIKGSSRGIEEGKVSKYLYNVLPFEGRTDHETLVESYCELNYKYPGKVQITPLTTRSFGRNGNRILKESFDALIPIYTFRRMHEKGNNKSYVIPFSKEGLEKYKFSNAIDSFAHEGSIKRYIYFEPKHNHHTLGSGYLLVDKNSQVDAILFSGRVDFGKVDCVIYLGHDKKSGSVIPIKNHIRISYNYAGSLAANIYDCYFDFEDIKLVHKKERDFGKLDLTSIYGENSDTVDLDEVRPIQLSQEEDSLLSYIPEKKSKKRSFFKKLPERLVSSNDISYNGYDYRIYGPLDPSTFSYDKLNGITLRQRLRFQKYSDNGRYMILKPDFGYSFKSKNFRYRVVGEWLYNPQRQGIIRLNANNRTGDFSSKFKDAVDYILKDTTGLTYDDLDINYFNSHELKLEHSIEIANGLTLVNGIGYNYRRSRNRQTVFDIPDELDVMIRKNYADFSPYIRLSWTPRQYYYYEGRRKEYITSRYPTFTLEYTHGIKGVLGSTSDYGRLEFDVLQVLNLDDYRILSFHGGAGGFFNQKGEYFINYNFFSRSLIPSAWEERIGGKFNLLDDHWYNSSPAYIQLHVTYESPFLLLHKIGIISKYVIKERIYSSVLWSEGRTSYSELGYGIGNNYFSLGLFSSFAGLEYKEFGVKFLIEIDSHI